MKQPTAEQYRKVEVYAKRLADAIEDIGDAQDADAVTWVRQWQDFAREMARDIQAREQRELKF